MNIEPESAFRTTGEGGGAERRAYGHSHMGSLGVIIFSSYMRAVVVGFHRNAQLLLFIQVSFIASVPFSCIAQHSAATALLCDAGFIVLFPLTTSGL